MNIFRKVKALPATLKCIVHHPLNRGRKLSALRRFLWWQIQSRMKLGPIPVPFVNQTKLWVENGMTGATGNVYCGLHEFEFMGFALHLLRPKDLFVDVGANVGSYSILAASLGARCIAFEPILKSYQALSRNISNNQLEALITPYFMALGEYEQTVKMVSHLDTLNHIIEQDTVIDQKNVVMVQTDMLDHMIEHDTLITLLKIDTEGYEDKIIRGSKYFLAQDAIWAIIVETGNLEVHEIMKQHGFSTHTYDPLTRTLIPTHEARKPWGNYLYIHKEKRTVIADRLKLAQPFKIMGRSI